MAEVKAFKALRFTGKAGDPAKNLCPPYDIISPSEREALISESENNLVRLELPQGENAYREAAILLDKWLSDGVVAEDKQDGIYIYEEEFTAFGQRKRIKGIVALVKIEEFSKGVILPHEDTLSKAKQDRFNLMKACGCNFSQIYSMFIDPDKKISGKVNELSKGAPDEQAVTDDGIIHRLWISTDDEANAYISRAFADKQLFIADGHHRYETSLNYRNYLREQGLAKEGDKSDYVMMFLIDIDDEGLVIFPTHRMIRDLSSFNEESVIERSRDFFEIERVEGTGDIDRRLLELTDSKSYAFYTGRDYYYILTLKKDVSLDSIAPERSQAYRDLDVTALHSLILERVMGIDKENMANGVNLTYTRSLDEAVEKVQDGSFQCSFILNPTKIHQIKDVAAAGDRMPQKSTYFYPKLITGMVMNKIR
ncbi:MAG: DUF1015 domain-containing protein [Firmicutes bacterium]|nr:DUF1015 domain-containing protein [Bacillota bacterium]